VYKGSLLSHLDSSLLNSPCSTFAFLLSSAWLLTIKETLQMSRFLEAFGKLHSLLKLALQAVMYKLAYDPSVAGVPYLAYRSS
jgi:hypothetical protein